MDAVVVMVVVVVVVVVMEMKYKESRFVWVIVTFQSHLRSSSQERVTWGR